MEPIYQLTQAAEPATKGQLPEVEVIQKKNTNKAAAAPKPKKSPTPKPPPVDVAEPVASQEPTYALPEAPGTVSISPLPGSEVPIEKIPRGVTSLSSADINREHSVIPQDFLNSRVPGVTVDDLQGNSFQTGIQYRGFEASPVNGLPQGLAVYQNGVRINEAFGDTVNWDFIPENAISDLAIMGSNPIFGLNAIGGSLAVTMKDGFAYQGGEVDTRFGSFGRRQVATEAGAKSGAFALYGAFEGINDDGFRDFSDAEVRRGYADLGVKTDNAEFHFNFTGADNYVGVTAAVPPELLAFGDKRTFTSPQTTFNDMQMYSLNGTVKATNTLTFSGVTYLRRFNQKHDDGNIAEFDECAGGVGLCTEDGEQIFAADNPGVPIDVDAFEALGPLGSIDRTSQNAKGYGVALQATETSRLFGLGNTFVIGSSYDRGEVDYTASSQLGTFLPRFVVAPTGPLLGGTPTIEPRMLSTTNDYFGVYAVDTLDLTNQLSLTLGGRFNHARIQIENEGAPFLDTLNGINEYNRFNPSAGLTYKFNKGLSAYGGYSEANRAPTASEIACSDPENPCIIESALASDPPLEQVVSKTWEAGLRGEQYFQSGLEKFEWSLGVFRSDNSDDIIQIADSQQGRGYFANFGDTRRQGFEAAVSYRAQRFFTYASYAFIDATFESAGIIPSENNPASEECPVTDPVDPGEEEPTCVFVSPGDRLPGVPRHRFKAGFDYWITPKWVFGADLISASNQIFYGDEGNDNTPLAGYYRINLHSSYNVTDNIQVYGLIENLTDQRYGIYGTYINVEAANGAAAADPSLPPDPFAEGNARTITPAIPFAAYGGVKIKF
ncbi:TonB-dependent receptor [Hyphomicrobium sp.]|uniref:TonB-dependent receptor n=1 Tax=Hyphomicrobium sp. TaxID=82 RepID=UPI003F701CA8